MATNIYENESVVDKPPPFNSDCSDDTIIYEVFDSEIIPEPTSLQIEFDPIVANDFPNVFENSSNPSTDISVVFPDFGIPTTSIETETIQHKFPKTILFLYELYTLQFIENLLLKLSIHSSYSQACKIVFQLSYFLFFLLLTIELNRELFLEYRTPYLNQTGTITRYQHIDVITIIISISFSLLSLISLAFLFKYSNILSDTEVQFQPWTLHSFMASWLPNCVLIAVYILTFVWFIITNILKCFVNLYILTYFEFSTFGVGIFSIIFFLQGFILHSSLFLLCFMIRSICTQLHFETDCEIEGVKKSIQNMVIFNPKFMLNYFDQINRMSLLNGKVKLIATVFIINVFFVVSTIFLSAFNDQDVILKVGQNDGLLPQVSYLWLVFVSCYLLILTLWVIQGITALNMKINKFSDLILIDKQVRQHLSVLDSENHQNFLEIRRNLNFISTSKSRFQVGIFGDLTNSLFHIIVVFGLVLMVPFILKIPNYIQNLKL